MDSHPVVVAAKMLMPWKAGATCAARGAQRHGGCLLQRPLLLTCELKPMLRRQRAAALVAELSASP